MSGTHFYSSGEGEAEALAPQDQREPRAVRLGEEPLGALANREQQLLGFVEAQRSGGHVELVAHLADGHELVGQLGWPSCFLPPQSAANGPVLRCLQASVTLTLT